MRSRTLLFALLVSASSPLLAGCPGDSAKTASLKPDDMPSGHEWTGVYFHPVYGYLHVEEQDANILGRWKRTDQSAWGELAGVKVGNVVHYQWKEHKYGLVGPAATTQGKGYFQYKVDDEQAGVLHGQFGMGSDEMGSDWTCKKQKNLRPDFKSITGTLPDSTPSTSGLE